MAPDSSLLLRCGRLFDPQRRQLTGASDVLIEGDVVVSVGPELAPGDARVVDLSDSTLLPGLVDLDADLIAEPVTGDNGLWLFEALAQAGDLLRRGFVTARVPGGADERWSLLDLRRAIVEDLAAGCDLHVAPHRLDDRLPQTGLARAAKRERRNGADWIAVDRREITVDDLRAVVRAAEGAPVSVAAHSTSEANAAIAAGARSVEASCGLDAATMRLAAGSGVSVVPRDGFGAVVTEESPLGYGGRLTGGIHALAELSSVPGALVAATAAGARCLALQDRGSIAAGSRADLVAVAGDPLADLGLLDSPSLVVKRGKIQP